MAFMLLGKEWDLYGLKAHYVRVVWLCLHSRGEQNRGRATSGSVVHDTRGRRCLDRGQNSLPLAKLTDCYWSWYKFSTYDFPMVYIK